MQESFDNSYDPDAISDLGSDFLSVECLEKLGLDENPFIDHARDPFLFIDQQLEMSVNVLVDYLQNQNSTLALLGEIGVGKTTLLRILLRKGYQHFNFCTLRAKSSTTFGHVEQKIKERWRIPESNSDEALESDEYITKYIETNKHPVIIIDDAHRLKTHELDALLQLKHRVGLQSSQALGLVLASEPSIQTKLTELEQTNPAATHIYQINALAFDAKQCEQYINFRLKKAGADNIDLFTHEQIQEFYNKAQGLPRVINTLAREALTERCQQQSRHTSQAHGFALTPGVRLGLILATLIGIAFLIGTFFKQPKVPVELDLSKPETDQEEIQTDSETVVAVDSPIKKEADETTSQPKKILKPYVAPLVLGPLEIEPVTPTEKPKKIVEPDKIVETGKADQAIQKTIPFPPDWLLKQDPNAYTVQIVASPSQENLFAFTEKYFEDQQTAYYVKSRQEKQWYILVYGVFTSREEALAAIEKLPSEVQKNKPYALQIDKIHQVIRQ